MKTKYYLIVLIIFAIAACKPEIDEFSPDRGKADFTSYLALGNSLTAGYADGSLYKSAQEASFANILAKQFEEVGGGEFKQPLMVDDYGIGFEGSTPVPKLILGPRQDCTGETSLAPVRAPVGINPANLISIADQGPFNNIAVPGTRTYHLFYDQYAQANPYYGRFAPSLSTPLIDLTAAIDATFFSLWLGSNDILGYALAGGASDSITDLATFTYLFDQTLQACINNQQGAFDPALGVVLNIPDILDIPYLSFMNTKLPYNGLVLTATQAAQLTLVYQAAGHPEITFEEGPNPWVIRKPDGNMGRMTADDMFLLSLPTDSVQCFGMGSANPDPSNPYPFPIPHKYILDESEINNIMNATDAYNAAIFDLCTMYGLAHVDMRSKLKEANAGIVIDGFEFTNTFIEGNVFSLDGIHLTAAGSAMVAYYCIEEINKTYNASIPQVVVTDYYGVTYP